MSRQQIEYFGIPIEFELTRKQVKNINIRINEDGIISVSAGKSVPVADIKAFVESRAEWIIRNLADLERYNSAKPDNDIYNGKKLYILGNAYVARVVEDKKDRVEVEDGIVKKVRFEGGCNGNTKGISALVEGMKVEDVIAKLSNMVTSIELMMKIIMMLLRFRDQI